MAPEKVIARSFTKIMTEFWFDLFLFVFFTCLTETGICPLEPLFGEDRISR